MLLKNQPAEKEALFMPNSFNQEEEICEHECHLTLNELKITKITITDHPWKKPGREWITHEMIVELVMTLDGRQVEPEPKKNPSDREVFVRNRMPLRDRKFRLIFWFKDNTTNHLWIRNCHPQN